MTPLPSDPERIRLAAIAGRVTEARSELERLLTAGATDQELAPWLSAILMADPGWLETFVLRVPDERRASLLHATMLAMMELQPDSVWNLVRRSPSALAVMKNPPPHVRRDLLRASLRSKLATEVLFDPATGLNNEELAKIFANGAGSVQGARRIFQECAGGRWEGEMPDCIRAAWYQLRDEDEAKLRELEACLPEAIAGNLAKLEKLKQSIKPGSLISSDPSSAELIDLGGAGIAALSRERTEAGRPLPLETVAALPEELQPTVFNDYISGLFPFNAPLAERSLDQLEGLPLSDAIKDKMRETAAGAVWEDLGDIETALSFAAKITDEAMRIKATTELLENYAQTDPPGAMERAAGMEAGPQRDRFEKTIKAALP